MFCSTFLKVDKVNLKCFAPLFLKVDKVNLKCFAPLFLKVDIYKWQGDLEKLDVSNLM